MVFECLRCLDAPISWFLQELGYLALAVSLSFVPYLASSSLTRLLDLKAIILQCFGASAWTTGTAWYPSSYVSSSSLRLLRLSCKSYFASSLLIRLVNAPQHHHIFAVRCLQYLNAPLWTTARQGIRVPARTWVPCACCVSTFLALFDGFTV